MSFKFVLMIAALSLAAPMAQACTKPANAAAMEREMIAWINAQRKSKGLNTLSNNARLEKTAQGHACDMADRGYFSHQRAGGPDLGRRLKSNGYRYRTAAENIAKVRSGETSRAAQIWRESAPHWSNILKSNVSDIGIGIAMGDGRYYWVMNVGRSK